MALARHGQLQALWQSESFPKHLHPPETTPGKSMLERLIFRSKLAVCFKGRESTKQKQSCPSDPSQTIRLCAKINWNPPVSFHCINLDDGDWLNWLILTPRNQAILSQITSLLYIHTPNTYITDWVSAHLAFLRGRVFTIPKKLPTENCQANRFTKNSFECLCCRLFAERNYSTPKQ